MFVSAIEDEPVLLSPERVDQLVEFAENSRTKILFVQIYRANQAWFPSDIASTDRFEEGVRAFGADPFGELIIKAHAKGIQVHAWLNLLSLGNNKNAKILAKYGPEILTRNVKPKRRIEDYRIDNQYFLEPGDPRVRDELARMVEEIVRAYPQLDGLQFDYIRYPDVKPFYGWTQQNIARFQQAHPAAVITDNSPDWQNWKRQQVTELLLTLVAKARSIRPDIKVSTTGCVSFARAYYEAFQDWPFWLNSGMIDFVTLMDYAPEPKDFARYIADAQKRVNDFSKVYVAVGAYKLLKSPRKFARELDIVKESGAGGCIVFYYGNLKKSSRLQEIWLR